MSDSMDANIKRLWFLVNTVGSTMERAALLSLTDALGDQRREERERHSTLHIEIRDYLLDRARWSSYAMSEVDASFTRHAPPAEEPADAETT